VPSLFSFRLKLAGLYRASRTACGKAQGSWTKKAGAQRILFVSGGKYCQRLALYRLVHKLAISKDTRADNRSAPSLDILGLPNQCRNPVVLELGVPERKMLDYMSRPIGAGSGWVKGGHY
jgi:hypothetical protein